MVLPSRCLTSETTSSSIPSTLCTLPSRPFTVPYRRVTGRQSETTSSAFSHSAISGAFPTVADRAIICASGLLCLLRDSSTSSVGPRPGSCKRWNSSLMTIPPPSISSEWVRSSESNFSLVHTKMSDSSIIPVSPSLSPIAMPTLSPTLEASCLSSVAFSLAKAFRGTM